MRADERKEGKLRATNLATQGVNQQGRRGGRDQLKKAGKREGKRVRNRISRIVNARTTTGK